MTTHHLKRSRNAECQDRVSAGVWDQVDLVLGDTEPVLVKELPLEYAVELNRLIQLQMEGSVG